MYLTMIFNFVFTNFLISLGKGMMINHVAFQVLKTSEVWFGLDRTNDFDSAHYALFDLETKSKMYFLGFFVHNGRLEDVRHLVISFFGSLNKLFFRIWGCTCSWSRV